MWERFEDMDPGHAFESMRKHVEELGRRIEKLEQQSSAGHAHG
jgi:hypothetical protein